MPGVTRGPGGMPIVSSASSSPVPALEPPCGEIPHEAMLAGGGSEHFGFWKPTLRDGELGTLGGLFVGAGKMADDVALSVENLQRDFGCVVAEIVVDDRSVGGIVGLGFFRRQRRAEEAVVIDADRGGRSVEVCFRRLRRGCLAQRRDVVEDPERAAVRGGDQVTAVDINVADGGDGQIELQWLPVLAVIEGGVDAEFGSGEEQVALLGVFADGADKVVLGDAVDGELPGFAVVVGDVEIRLLIVEAMTIDGGVSGCWIEVRGFDERDFAPGSEFGRRDVAPGLAAIGGEVNAAGVAAGPDFIGAQRRGRNGVDDAVAALLGVLGWWLGRRRWFRGRRR